MGGERGSVALLGVIMMMFLGLLGVTLLMLSKTEIQLAANQRDGLAAQYLAEAGIQEAITKLKTDPSFIYLTEKSNQVTTSQSLGALPTVGNYNVQTGPNLGISNKEIRLITATGKVNKAQRQVVVKITLPSNEHRSFSIIWN